jgi:hypothetical protein
VPKTLKPLGPSPPTRRRKLVKISLSIDPGVAMAILYLLATSL